MEIPRQNTDSTDEASESLFHSRRRCCCFSLPCFDRRRNSSSGSGSTWWQSIRTAETAAIGSVWSRGVGALMKIREWSEIAAGPRWKTFIRRFSRNRSGNKHVNFQYDALSYAMNFDEGQNGNLDEGEEDGFYAARNFSSRYAKGSVNLGKEGPTFV